jgi:hypothetical protein
MKVERLGAVAEIERERFEVVRVAPESTVPVPAFVSVERPWLTGGSRRVYYGMAMIYGLFLLVLLVNGSIR